MNNDVKEAALWMMNELVYGSGTLSREYVIMYLPHINPDLTYFNRYGNIAISPKVLYEFRKLMKKYYVDWDSSKKEWQFFGERYFC